MRMKKAMAVAMAAAMLAAGSTTMGFTAAAEPAVSDLYQLVDFTDFENGDTWGFVSTDQNVAPVTVVDQTDANKALEWAINRSRSTRNGGMYNVEKRFDTPIYGEQVKVEFDWRPGETDYVKREGLVHLSQVSLIDEDRNVIFSINNNVLHDGYLSYTVGEGGTSNGSYRKMLPFSDVWAWYHVSIEVDFAKDEINLIIYDKANPEAVTTVSGIDLSVSNQLGNLGHIDLRMIRPGGDCMILDSMLIDNMAVYKTASTEDTAVSTPAEYDFTTVYVGAAPTLADVKLPSVVDVKLANGNTVSVPVTSWSCPDYNNAVSGMYLATATLGTAQGVTLSRDLTAHMWVYVRETVENRLEVSRLVENLDRGVVALQADDGIFVSWRLLASEYQADIAFNVYRNGSKINETPITTKTNLLDPLGKPGDEYVVQTIKPNESEWSEAVTASSENFLSIPIQKPANTTDVSGKQNISYNANDIMTADLDGDGQYEYIVRWYPSNGVDSGSNGRLTGPTIFDAYDTDGTILWRINIGYNMTSGEHYNQLTVQDYNGDGKAEVALLTADGTTVYAPDRATNTIDMDCPLAVIGDPTADYVIRTNSEKNNSANRVGHISEDATIFFTMFDGATGAPIDTVDYYAQTVNAGFWGDLDYNRSDRYKATSAFIQDADGAATGHNAALMCRGYYERTTVAAYSLDENNKIRLDWAHDTWYYDEEAQTWKPKDGNNFYECRGAHSTTVADVDNDGFDEFIGGAYCLDQDGTVLWSADGLFGRPNLAHGDALHVGAFLPGVDGLQLMMPHEELQDRTNSVSFLDAATGECLSGNDTNTGDVGRGVIANIDPNPGFEYWASGYPVYSAVDGSVAYESQGGMPTNFTVYWDGDLLTENLDKTNVTKPVVGEVDGKPAITGNTTLLSMTGTTHGNGSKGVPGLTADVLGDWREEIIMRTSDNTAIRIYSTTTPTDYMIYTLMHDSAYRMQCAGQMGAYNQPNHLSFYLGEDVRDQILNMELVKPNTYTVDYNAVAEASATPNPVSPDEPFTATIVTDLTVDWVDLYNEAGNGLVSTNRSMVEANGLRTWTLTTSLGTAGERTLSIGTTLADGSFVMSSKQLELKVEKTISGDPSTFQFVKVTPKFDTAKVNEPITYEVVTKGDVERLAFFNESGAGLTTAYSVVEQNGQKVWTIGVPLGTPGKRTLSIRAKLPGGAWSDGYDVSLTIVR